jgi:hypothetical protein
LTGDHLRWPAENLADVEVVCRSCNSKRGPRRGVYRKDDQQKSFDNDQPRPRPVRKKTADSGVVIA